MKYLMQEKDRFKLNKRGFLKLLLFFAYFLGALGRGVIILYQNKEEIMKRSGYEIEISKILVRDLNKSRDVEVPENILF